MRYFFIIFFSCTSLFLQSQSLLQSADMAQKAFEEGDYVTAADIFQHLMDAQPFTSEFILNYADACRLAFSYDNAIDAYETYLKAEPKPAADAYFWLAELITIKKGCKYALKYYREYQSLACCSPEFEKAQNIITSCDKKYRPQAVEKTNQPHFNSDLPEYAPVLSESGMIYSCYPTMGEISKTKLCANTADSSLIRIIEAFNKAGENQSGLCFTPDSLFVYSSSCIYQDREKRCRLLYSKVNGNKFEIDSLPFSNASQPHISVQNSDTLLYFISDNYGSIGGMDIWKVKLANGLPSGNPENMGEHINTVFNEISPFFDRQRNELYYSSDRGPWGGFEIYRFNFDSLQNTRLPEPYNSNYNDLYFSFYKDTAIWISNRKAVEIDDFRMYLNDIYTAPIRLPEPKQRIIERQKDSAQQVLDSLLPLYVYFDNDMPDPRSNDSSTFANYYALGQQLLLNKAVYDQKNTGDSISLFFSEVESSLYKLEQVSQYILEQLSKGLKVKLLIKAYTSASSSEEYNYKLAKRRNASLINYFLAYRQGALSLHYGRNLHIKQLPVGEAKLAETEPYSLEALKQRRVELYFLLD